MCPCGEAGAVLSASVRGSRARPKRILIEHFRSQNMVRRLFWGRLSSCFTRINDHASPVITRTHPRVTRLWTTTHERVYCRRLAVKRVIRWQDAAAHLNSVPICAAHLCGVKFSNSVHFRLATDADLLTLVVDCKMHLLPWQSKQNSMLTPTGVSASWSFMGDYWISHFQSVVSLRVGQFTG